MNRRTRLVAFVLVGILLYIVLANLLAGLFKIDLPGYESTSGPTIDNGDVNIGVSDSVSVSVTRFRWYGTIFEGSNSQGKTSTLYLFGIVKFPLYVNGTNLFLTNIILALVLVCAVFFTLKSIRKREIERGYY